MKKLKLNPSVFANRGDVLSKAQLRKVMGGSGSGSSGSGTKDVTKIEACQGKSQGAECIWVYQGTPYTGHCQSYMAQPLACSSLI